MAGSSRTKSSDSKRIFWMTYSKVQDDIYDPNIHQFVHSNTFGRDTLKFLLDPVEPNKPVDKTIKEDGRLEKLLRGSDFKKFSDINNISHIFDETPFIEKGHHAHIYGCLLKMIPRLDMKQKMEWIEDGMHFRMFMERNVKMSVENCAAATYNFEFRSKQQDVYFDFWNDLFTGIELLIRQIEGLIMIMKKFDPNDFAFHDVIFEHAMDYFHYITSINADFSVFLSWLKPMQPHFDSIIDICQNLIGMYETYKSYICGAAIAFFSTFMGKTKAEKHAKKESETKTLLKYHDSRVLTKLPHKKVLGRIDELEDLITVDQYHYKTDTYPPLLDENNTTSISSDFFIYTRHIGERTGIRTKSRDLVYKGENPWFFAIVPAPIQFGEIFTMTHKAGTLFKNGARLFWKRSHAMDDVTNELKTMNAITKVIKNNKFFNIAFYSIDI